MLSFGFGNVMIAAAPAGSVVANFSLRLPSRERRKLEVTALMYSLVAVLLLSTVQTILSWRAMDVPRLMSDTGISPVEILVIFLFGIVSPETSHWTCFVAIVLGAAAGAYLAFSRLGRRNAENVDDDNYLAPS